MTNALKLDDGRINIDKLLASIPTATAANRAKMQTKAEVWLGKEIAGEREAAKRMIDALNAQAQNERDQRYLALRELPETERIVRAFSEIPMNKIEMRVVQVLLDNPGLTSTALSLQLKWQGKMWHLRFGEMCKRREAYFEQPPHAERRNAPFWSGLLADLLEPENLFVMKPEAVAAFRQLSIRASS